MPPRTPDDRRTCAYCGKELSRRTKNSEHVIGRQFFPEPRPVDLDKIVVPSCRACNEEFKHDEDYFRGMLCFSDAALSGTGKQISDRFVARTLKYDPGVKRAIGRQMRPVWLRTPQGVYVRRAVTQTIAWPRVERVMAKWVRGLHWKQTGQRLELAETPAVAFRPPTQLNDGFHLGEPIVGLGSWPDTIEYWFSRDAADANKTRWTFLVWNTFGLAVVTNDELPVQPVEAYFSESFPNLVVDPIPIRRRRGWGLRV